jgi:hypothetical protein
MSRNGILQRQEGVSTLAVPLLVIQWEKMLQMAHLCPVSAAFSSGLLPGPMCSVMEVKRVH